VSSEYKNGVLGFEEVLFMKIRAVGIIGCGQMGRGIARICTQSGFKVLISDISQTLLQKGLTAIAASLDRNIRKGIIQPSYKDVILARILGTTNNEEHHDCDLVIEAIIEDLEVKKRVFYTLDQICKAYTLLATNTSSLSVSEITTTTSRPDRVLGLHFFNPVPAMKLMEIVRTDATGKDTVDAGKAFGESLGKTVVVVQDSPGFIVNRLMVPQILNAIYMVESNTAAKEDIDTAITLGLNNPVGPIALADIIGLDTLLSIAESIYQKLGDAQYAAPEMLKRLVVDNHLGRKTGRGFYEYK
jgi:3-hydroxybutyryl-CoA dehydrogenase